MEEVAAADDQIGVLAGLDRTDAVFDTEDLGGVERDRAQRRVLRESAANRERRFEREVHQVAPEDAAGRHAGRFRQHCKLDAVLVEDARVLDAPTARTVDGFVRPGLVASGQHQARAAAADAAGDGPGLAAAEDHRLDRKLFEEIADCEQILRAVGVETRDRFAAQQRQRGLVDAFRFRFFALLLADFFRNLPRALLAQELARAGELLTQIAPAGRRGRRNAQVAPRAGAEQMPFERAAGEFDDRVRTLHRGQSSGQREVEVQRERIESVARVSAAAAHES